MKVGVCMSKLEPPTGMTKEDYAHLAIKIGLGTIPVFGGGAAEIFGALVSPSHERRKQQFMQDVVDRLAELEAKGKIRIEDLKDNEEFVSAATTAAHIALRNHRKEKLEALRNAVVNIAVGDAPDDTRQHMFLRMVDEFTPWHVRVMGLWRQPKLFIDRLVVKSGLPREIVTIEDFTCLAFPGLLEAQEILSVIYSDLRTRQLVQGSWNDEFDSTSLGILEAMRNPENYSRSMMKAGEAFLKRTTKLGDQFLSFITDPVSNSIPGYPLD